MSLLLGCIADDFTGATDLSNMLVRGGMRTVQCFGVPEREMMPVDADAVVLALKSRSSPRHAAVERSLAALSALQSAGAQRFLFKYCSTFDSTDQGNIGPVAEALMNALGVGQTIFCPAFPETGRTVYFGHLFVNGRLLSESGMQHHPLNPMTDPDLARVLQRQATKKVGSLTHRDIAHGPAAIQNALADLRDASVSLVIVDTLEDRNLADIALAVADMPLVTGGSGIALWLASAYRQSRELAREPHVALLPKVSGWSAILSGSCSQATQRQVAVFRQRHPSREIDIIAASRGQPVVHEAIDWAKSQVSDSPILIYSTASPDAVHAVQQALGRDVAAKTTVERTMAEIARELAALGPGRLIVAGGETAGAVVEALGIRVLRIGPQIDPGVPWTESLGQPRLALSLKSGNFGADDFFVRALEMLQ